MDAPDKGAPLPPPAELPQAVMLPSHLSAANASWFEVIFVYPVSVGAPLPP